MQMPGIVSMDPMDTSEAEEASETPPVPPTGMRMNPITAFFKPPSKPKLESADKGKGILGYFQKSTKANGKQEILEGITQSKHPENEKELDENLNDSLQEFEEVALPSKKSKERTKKTVKKKGKISSKESTKSNTKKSSSLDETEVSEISNTVEKKDSEIISYADFLKESKGNSELELDLANENDGVNGGHQQEVDQDIETSVQAVQDVKCKIEAEKKRLAMENGSTESDNTELEDLESEQDCNTKTNNVGSENLQANSSNFSQANDNVMEISYEAFLSSQMEENQPDMDNIAKTKSASPVKQGEKQDEENSCESESNVTELCQEKNEKREAKGTPQKKRSKKEEEQSEIEKSNKEKSEIQEPVVDSEVNSKKAKVGGIAQFFTKIENKGEKKVKKDSETVTVKAVVHTELTTEKNIMVHPEDSNKTGRKRRSNVVVDCTKDDLVITHLESRIITLPEKRSRKKKEEKMPVEINSNVGESHEKIDGNSNEVTQLGKSVSLEKENKTEENTCEDVESKIEVDEKKKQERRELASMKMASLDTMKIPTGKKTTQATLCFGGKGGTLQTVKPPPLPPPKKESVKEKTPIKTRVRKVKDDEDEDSDSPFATPKQRKRKPRNVIESDTEMTPQKQKPNRKGCKNKPKDNVVNVTPKKRNVSRRREKESESSAEDSVEEADDEIAEVAKTPVKKSLYRTEVIDSGKKKKELKVKFTKVKRNKPVIAPVARDDDEILLTLRRSKALVNIAQQIVQKARDTHTKKSKKRATKGKHVKNQISKEVVRTRHSKKEEKTTDGSTSEDDQSNLRRSSRHSSQVAKMAISECLDSTERRSRGNLKREEKEVEVVESSAEEEEEESKPKKAIRKSKKEKTPKKPKPKSPKKLLKRSPKKTVKLASIFNKGKKSLPDDDEDDDDVQVINVEVDPEKEKIRRAFLMSGVPEELRKQKIISETYILSEYPPVPTISHVQQSSGGQQIIPSETSTSVPCFNPWQLQEVTLPLRNTSYYVHCDYNPVDFPIGTVTHCQRQISAATINQEFTGYVDLDSEVVRYLLAEVHAHNPLYPVRRVYKQLAKKLREAMGKPDPNADDGALKNCEEKSVENVPTKSKSRKRKLDMSEADPQDSEAPGKRRSKRRKGEGEETYSQPERRSTRRKISDDDCKIMEDSNPEVDQNTDTVTGEKDRPRMQWTEKYQPQHSSEIIGNSKMTGKLKSWLSDWKHRTDLEIRKMKKQLKKAAKKGDTTKEEITKKFGSDWWTDDESDFEMGSDGEDSDYEEEDDGLCNTMLLTGPHGVGKTAMVYALAQELGYKVFEVNASSKRAGRQLLAQLQEATQSHQVGKENLDAMFTTFKQTELKAEDAKKPEKKMPTAFTNLFKKGVKDQAKDQPKSKSVKGKQDEPKIKGKKAEGAKQGGKAANLFGKKFQMPLTPGTPNSSKGLNLSSTSLILFEEVELVFEDDKGFWAAIQTFMSTTKRPIILTSADPKVSRFIESRHETISLKQSPSSNLTSYLQVMCLAENMRTDFEDIQTLAELCHGDLRRAILNLQFWAESGGGIRLIDKPVKYLPKFFTSKKEGEEIKKTSQTQAEMEKIKVLPLENSVNSADDFTPVKRRGRRVARPILEDDSDASLASPLKPVSALLSNLEDSQSGADSPGPAGYSSIDNSQETEMISLPKDCDLTTAEITVPSMHQLCFNSSTGCISNNMTVQESNLYQMCQCPETVAHYKDMGVDLVYSNLPFLLCLPKCELNLSTLLHTASIAQVQIKKHSRIMNLDVSDIFDSGDESDDNFVSLNKDKDNSEEILAEERKGNDEGHVEKRKLSPAEQIAGDAVTSLADMYDCMSFMDSYVNLASMSKEGPCSKNNEFEWPTGALTPGLNTDLVSWDETNWWKYNHMHELVSHVEVACLKTTNCKLAVIKSKKQTLDGEQAKLLEEKFSLPVSREDLNSCKIKLCQENSEQKSAKQSHQRAARTVSGCLPCVSQSLKRNVALDVMPTLRTMSRFEQARQVTNTKRRFMHYFDSISLGLRRKEQVMGTLCSSFI